MTDPISLRYSAFLSYSHRDGSWGRWLHRSVEKFNIGDDLIGRSTPKGPVPKTLYPVFRDRDEFAAGHTLNAQTLAALDQSGALIVLCSPSAAKSHYVNEEVRLFKHRHPTRPVIPVIVAGRDGKDEERFPPALRFKIGPQGQVTAVPDEAILAADARAEADGEELALAKVVACLIGVPVEDIFRRLERARRRNARIRNAVIAALAILAVTATGTTVFAWQQLRTNETLLDQTLKRATEFVSEAVAQAEQFGVSRATTFGLLKTAEGLFEDMAAHGRDTPQIRHRKALMLIEFARNYEMLGHTQEQRARAEEAHGLLERLAAETPNDPLYQYDLSIAQSEMGDVLLAQGERAFALKSYLTSLALRERLVRAYPDNPTWRRGLSVSHNKIGDVLMESDVAAALESYRTGLGIITDVVEAAPENAGWQRDRSTSYSKVGDALFARGEHAAAIDSYNAALAVSSRLAADSRENVQLQRDLSVLHSKLGEAFQAQGDLAAALKHYEADLAIAERLAAADPGNARWQHDLSVTHINIGDVLRAQQDFAPAREKYQAALAIRLRLADGNPTNMRWQRSVAFTRNDIGDMLRVQSDTAAALESYRQALAIAERHASDGSDDVQWTHQVATCHCNMGDVLLSRGEFAAALSSHNTCNRIIADLAARDLDNTFWQFDLVLSHVRLALAEEFAGLDDPEPALDLLRQYDLLEWAVDEASHKRRGELAGTLFKLAKSRDAPTRHLKAALEIMRRQEAAQRLSATQKPWLMVIENALAALEA